MRRLRVVLAMCALVLCTSCAGFMPNTAEAIAPATFGDLWLGVEADVEQWVMLFLMVL